MSRLIRILPSFLGGIIGAVGFLLLTGAGSKPQAKQVGRIPDVIEARKVVTQQVEISPRVPGGLTGFLNSDASGGVKLAFVGPDNRIRAGLESSKDGKSSLRIDNADGGVMVALDSEPSIRIYDGKVIRVAIGQSNLTLKSSGVNEKTRPGIVIFDEVGSVIWQQPQ